MGQKIQHRLVILPGAWENAEAPCSNVYSVAGGTVATVGFQLQGKEKPNRETIIGVLCTHHCLGNVGDPQTPECFAWAMGKEDEAGKGGSRRRPGQEAGLAGDVRGVGGAEGKGGAEVLEGGVQAAGTPVAPRPVQPRWEGGGVQRGRRRAPGGTGTEV